MPEFTTTIKDKTLVFTTSQTIFSPSGLDRGTAAMLSVVDFLPEDYVLDLGCGCGIVGILAASLLPPKQVVMCDISEEAVQLSTKNARQNGISEELVILQSDGFSNIPNKDFTKILSNPPYHTDFSVAKNFIENSWRHLAAGGMLYMVTKRREWYKNKLISVFGGVSITEIDGYFVFAAQKRLDRKKPKSPKQPPKLSKKLSRKLFKL